MTEGRRLTRSKNKMIAGVCAGIAEYFGWDTTLFRVVFVVVSILSVAFPGIVVYLVLWVVMPRPVDTGS
jgi:phage shock protein C